MIVGMWMTREVFTLSPQDSIGLAARQMAARGVRRIPITDTGTSAGALVGMVSQFDVACAFPASVNPTLVQSYEADVDEPIASIMATDLVTVATDTPVEEAVQLLCRHKIGALPVLRLGLLRGIITESDIFRAFVEMTGVGTGRSVRVTFDLAQSKLSLRDLITRSGDYDLELLSLLTMVHADESSPQGSRRLAVARVTGTDIDRAIDALLEAGLTVLDRQQLEEDPKADLEP